MTRYWTVAGVTGKFCRECREDSPACSVCNAPARNARMRDSRIFCPGCEPRLFSDHDDYDGVYQRMARRAKDVLGLELGTLPELVVESKHSIGERPGVKATLANVCGLYARDGLGRATIHVLSHLPESRVSAVLAHELAHAWQAENCPDEQGLRVREGFAEWVAWRLLEGLDGCEQERTVIESRTDEYGQGFRLFSALEERRGAPEAVWYATAARSSP